MISDYLDRGYVLESARGRRDLLAELAARVRRRDADAKRALRATGMTLKEVDRLVRALDASLERAATAKVDATNAYIPSDPLLCLLQSELTEQADRTANVSLGEVREEFAPRRTKRRGVGPIDTSAPSRLKRRSERVSGVELERAAFVEEGWEQLRYALEWAKAAGETMLTGRRPFNSRPARVAASERPLRLFVFGDWGTGLPLAQAVAARIREQLAADDGSRQQHVVHLGDVYYAGKREEYVERVLAAGLWPVDSTQKDRVGSWSLNGNHDMYAGGHGYFDTMLRDARFLRWHRDERGDPSSFFLIEDPHWQFFGLDTAWNMPSLGAAMLGDPTFEDHTGQNGILTPEQARWMAERRDAAKGCVLMTHHQPGSSRSHEKQHADEAVRMLRDAGVYPTIDAWLWGHEHRCVVFHPPAKRKSPRLIDAPEFCVCLGNSGVPVTAKPFAADKRLPDVAWEEDRFGSSSPMYEGQRVAPFSFARVDSAPGTLDFRIFDHSGDERYRARVSRAARR